METTEANVQTPRHRGLGRSRGNPAATPHRPLPTLTPPPHQSARLQPSGWGQCAVDYPAAGPRAPPGAHDRRRDRGSTLTSP